MLLPTIASLFKWDVPYIFAPGDNISADKRVALSLCNSRASCVNSHSTENSTVYSLYVLSARIRPSVEFHRFDLLWICRSFVELSTDLQQVVQQIAIRNAYNKPQQIELFNVLYIQSWQKV